MVIAAGLGTAALAAGTGTAVSLAESPGLLVHSKPAKPVLDRLVLAPHVHVKQDPSGAVVAGRDFGGGPVGDDPEREAHKLLDDVTCLVPGLSGLVLDHITIGRRTLPADGLPVVGSVAEGRYVAVMHSGVTLAPLIGRAVAEELLSGTETALLRPFRPQRFG